MFSLDRAAGPPRPVSTLSIARRLASALLMAAAGCCAGAITFGLLTCFVYFIGLWLGAPLGAILGAVKGWRMPLRDATLLFVAYSAALAVAARQLNTHLDQSLDHDLALLLVCGFVAGPLAAALLPLALKVIPFFHRRIPAIIAAFVWTTAFLIWLYKTFVEIDQ